MEMNLSQKNCVPCKGGVSGIRKTQAMEFLAQLPKWQLKEDGKEIFKEWKFKNFKETIVFVNKVGEIAENEGHHPNIHITDWNKLRLEFSTQAIHALTENDFIMAAKINELE